MISFIIATSGRPTLEATLRSVECWPGDEVLVVGNVEGWKDREEFKAFRFIPHAPGGDWGHTERNDTMPLARGSYLSHMDDDDVYMPGARAAMQAAIDATPDRPLVFRMQYWHGGVLWQSQTLGCGNVGTPMVIMPNVPEKLGVWGSFYGGDFTFIESSKWAPEDYVWREEVIALLRPHNLVEAGAAV